MKVKLTRGYQGWRSDVFLAPGVHEVSEGLGKYLVETFDEATEEVDGQEEEADPPAQASEGMVAVSVAEVHSDVEPGQGFEGISGVTEDSIENPVCGAPTANGGVCTRSVAAAGEKCYQHS